MEKQQISGRFIAGEKAFSWTVDVRRIARASRCDLSMRDQICRAAASVSANIAEGAGHHHPGDQARFYSIARGSLMETLLGLRLLVAEGQVDHATAASLRDRGDEVGRILTGLIRNCHERRRAAVPR